MQSDWAVSSPSNAIIRCSKDGYIIKELFMELGEHIVQLACCCTMTTKLPSVVLLSNEEIHKHYTRII